MEAFLGRKALIVFSPTRCGESKNLLSQEILLHEIIFHNNFTEFYLKSKIP